MAIGGMSVAVDFPPTSIAWKLNQVSAPCDSDQRTAKRINSDADFNFTLMFERWASTVLTLPGKFRLAKKFRPSTR